MLIDNRSSEKRFACGRNMAEIIQITNSSLGGKQNATVVSGDLSQFDSRALTRCVPVFPTSSIVTQQVQVGH